MIFQPTNVYPDVKGGMGNGTIDVTEPLTVSWQVNGNTPLQSFEICFYYNTSSSVLLYTTGQVSDDCPFYGVDASGNVQFMSYTLQDLLTDEGFINGSEYKIIIKQWYGAGADDYIVQTSASVFYTRALPTLAIDAIPTPLAARSYTFTATYSQAQGDALNWVRWQIAFDDNTAEPFYDSGDIYGTAELAVSYDGFFTDNTYAIQCTVQTERGVEISTGWEQFTVTIDEKVISGDVTATCTKNKSAVHIEYSELTDLDAPLVSLDLYRRQGTENLLTHVASLDTTFATTEIDDYAACSQQGEYTYHLVPTIESIGEKTLSGEMVAFTADGLAFDALQVNIEAEQDLNGYDKPWPAGGGKNLLPNVKYQNTANEVSLGCSNSEWISLKAGTYTISYGEAALGRIFYRTLAGGTNISLTNTTVGTLTLAEDSDIRFWIYNSGGVDASDVAWFQLESGSIATAYAPYSNICPITGYTGANGTHIGKNFVTFPNGTTTNRGITFTKLNGAVTMTGTNDGTNASWHSLGNDWILKAGTYTLSGGGDTNVNMSLRNEATTPDVEIVNTRYGDVTFTLSEDTLVRLRCRVVTGYAISGSITFYPQIELGEEATAWEVYNGTTYTVSWQDDAGTVYYGYYDFISGKLVATYKLIVADGNVITVTSVTQSSSTGNYYCAIALNDALPRTDTKPTLSNMFKDIGSASTQIGNCYVNSTGTRLNFTLPDQTITTVAAANTWLASNNVQFAYALATPVEYDLTPQSINTFQGDNVVWSDMKSVMVKFLFDATQPQPLVSNAICPMWWNWTVLECEQDANGNYTVENEYRFANNISSGNVTNNNAPNILHNFTQYPTVQIAPQNYKSGTLQSLIGIISLDSATGTMKYSDSLALRDEIYALSTTKNPLFLKTRKGDLIKIKIAGAITMETSDNTREQMQTMELPWVEVGSTDGIAIIGY